MRTCFNLACIVLMIAGAVGGNLLAGWPRWCAFGLGGAALAAFLVAVLGGGGGPPGKWPGLRPPPRRGSGGALS